MEPRKTHRGIQETHSDRAKDNAQIVEENAKIEPRNKYGWSTDETKEMHRGRQRAHTDRAKENVQIELRKNAQMEPREKCTDRPNACAEKEPRHAHS